MRANHVRNQRVARRGHPEPASKAHDLAVEIGKLRRSASAKLLEHAHAGSRIHREQVSRYTIDCRGRKMVRVSQQERGELSARPESEARAAKNLNCLGYALAQAPTRVSVTHHIGEAEA